MISSGAIRLGASPLAKFTSSSARAIVAPTPSSLPRAAWRSKNAWATVQQGCRSARPGGRPAARRPPAGPPAGEDGVGEPDGQARPAADEEALPPLLEVRAREDVLLDAVVPEVVDAPVEVGNPQDLGLELQGERLLDLRRRRGDVERPDPGQLHRGREVDRQALRHRRIHPAHGQAHPRRAGDRLRGRRQRVAPIRPPSLAALPISGDDERRPILQRGWQRNRLRQPVAAEQRRPEHDRQQPAATASPTHDSPPHPAEGKRPSLGDLAEFSGFRKLG